MCRMQIATFNQNFNNISSNKKMSYSPTFGYRSAFSRQLDVVLDKQRVCKKDVSNLTSAFNDFVLKHFNSQRLLGAGFHGRVYKIDDKYAVKLPNLTADLFFFENIPKKKFGALKTYYGESVANFTHAKILKNVSSCGIHTQAGIPQKLLASLLPDDAQAYYENIYLPKFAAVPQRAFDAIAKDFDTLNKMGRGFNNYTFDFKNPNNFVLVGNTLRITDEISSTCIKNPNSIAEMLSVFLEKMNIETFAPYSDGAVPARRQLLRKIILAGMKCNLDFGDCPADKIIWNNIIENLCSLKVSSGSVMNTLKSMRKIVPEQKLRLKLTSDYLDNILSK